MKWGNLAGIFYQPAKVFEGMKADVKWQWLLPLAIAIAIGVASFFVIRPVMVPEVMANIAQRQPDMSPEMLEMIRGRVGSPLGAINVVIFVPLVALLIALVYWAAFSFTGAKTTFGHMFAATAWAGMANVLASFVRVPLIMAQQTLKVHTSLALILPPDMEEGFLTRLLGQLDIFTVWMLVLLAIGYATFTGVERRKAYAVVFGLWGVWALLTAALGGMFHFGMH
ncbi:MAG TPA: YIP1 family protein [Candidatus Edwardsbacteria bacterium]|nr:YIP1 family protein [Candidatus Edwardsbacteria bacterium]